VGRSNIITVSMLTTILFVGCSTTSPTIIKVEKPTRIQPQVSVTDKEPILKRKVAIARFGNEAQYGKSALFGSNNGYNAEKQATDILSAKLAQSGKFILLERNDTDKIDKEINSYNLQSLKIGADYLIVGSVSEFGRKNISDTGVFSRSKTQVAYAKVSVRLIDVKTGQIIFAQEGAGEAKSEAGKSFGVGKHVGYDSTLNDKAISTAISSVVDGIMQNLLSKPWRSYVLSVDENRVMIAGGKKQGLKVNDIFSIYKKGKSIKNPQTGMLIELPGTKIASVKIISSFGSSYTDEGSICQILNGNLEGVNINDLHIEK
jgi:curli biogenesis system outer membrane secretion channel CsgG